MSRTPPNVTGVSPKEGPPGTRITIRGENLGFDAKDLIGLKICGENCLLSAEWKSTSKIVARTGPGKGKGDVIVTTKSGGVGGSTVGFRGYFLQTGPLQESAMWTDESQTVLVNFGQGRPSSPMISKEDEDPLGISDEGNQAKFTEEELLEMFPEASGNLSLENFSPAWFLLENHHETNFEDLKAGLEHMKRRATKRSEGPIAFLKSNLSSTLDCLDSLSAMYEQFAADDIRGDRMNSYAVLLMQAKSCADGLFQEVLGRKDQADSTRNALNVLQRFKFLFYLPLNIERNIQKGDYSLVINDYVRARSLFADTQVQVFKKVYKEVECRINEFREMLHRKLLELPNTLDEQKKLIRYLINLECTGDPAWECLVNQQNWIVTILKQCRDDNVQQELNSAQSESEVNSGQWKTVATGVPSGLKKGRTKEHSFTSTTSPDQTGWKFRQPQKVMFVEDLTSIMTENIPDFWKLGQAYFSGSMLMKETGEKAYKIDASKHSQFKQMISEVINLFTNLLRAAFLPETLENIATGGQEIYEKWPDSTQEVPGAWLPYCVRHIRACVGYLSTEDLPVDSLDVVHELAVDMRTQCMFTLLRQAISDVRGLHTRETWVVETDDEFGGTSQLPALFENIVNEVVQHLHEVVVQNRTGEPEIFSQRPVQKEATSLCTQLLQAFATSLEHLAFTEVEHSNKGMVSPTSPNSSFNQTEEPALALDKRLIIMLSNCNHTTERVVPRLVENLNRHGYLEMNKAKQSVLSVYQDLDVKLFEAYVEEKSNPIVGVMEQNMYRGRFDWKTCTKVSGVRNYLKIVLMGMIEVHAEVFAISPAFVSRVMCKVVEAVCDEMSRLIHCVTDFSSSGALQARLELCAFQDAVALYKTPHTVSCFKEALDIVPSYTLEDKKTLEEHLNQFKSQMHFQLMCFQSDNVRKSSSSA